MNRIVFEYLPVLLSLFLLSACGVEKKIQEVTVKYETELAKVRDEYYGAQKEINQLNLTLAERKGENNELIRMQDKFQSQIDALELELQRRNNQAQTEKKTLAELLSAKDSAVAVQQGKIGAIEQLILTSYQELDSIAAVLRDSFQQFPAGLWNVEIMNQRIFISLQETLLFKSGVYSSIEEKHFKPLRIVADILSRYPLLFIEITGHHDNQPLPRRLAMDPWDYTVLRATEVARVMSREFEVSSARITPAGRGAFAPIESNETSAGQAKNRRIELTLFHAVDELPKKIIQLIRQ